MEPCHQGACVSRTRLGPGIRPVTMDRRNKILRVFCGIDWAEAHHDVALVDGKGTLIAKRRISDDAAGFAALIMLLADAGDSAEDPIPVAMSDQSWPAGRLSARHRAQGLCDQPDGGVPLSGSALGGAQKIRCRRCVGAGQHSAHRPGRPPAAAR